MSVKIMAAIFESETLGPTERLVMLALADHADDSGRCYPSIARLSRRTGLSERAVQTNIRKLTDSGYIRVEDGGGRGRSNLYFVSANPAGDAPRRKCTPAADAPLTPQQVHPTPAAGAPEPSRTINEPSVTPPPPVGENVLAILSQAMSREAAADFIAHRKAKRAKLTNRAAELIAAKLQGHPDPDQVIRMSVMNGWTGVFPEKTPANAQSPPSPEDLAKRRELAAQMARSPILSVRTAGENMMKAIREAGT